MHTEADPPSGDQPRARPDPRQRLLPRARDTQIRSTLTQMANRPSLRIIVIPKHLARRIRNIKNGAKERITTRLIKSEDKYDSRMKQRRGIHKTLCAIPPSGGEPDSTAPVCEQAAGTERGTQELRNLEFHKKKRTNHRGYRSEDRIKERFNRMKDKNNATQDKRKHEKAIKSNLN